jgi:hypothetical protein
MDGIRSTTEAGTVKRRAVTLKRVRDIGRWARHDETKMLGTRGEEATAARVVNAIGQATALFEARLLIELKQRG